MKDQKETLLSWLNDAYAMEKGQIQVLEKIHFELNSAVIKPESFGIMEEIADTLPAGLGRWLLRTNWARRIADRFTRRGRTVKTTSLRGFLSRWLLPGRGDFPRLLVDAALGVPVAVSDAGGDLPLPGGRSQP
mgnify:CR=1 FL=1